MVVPLLEGAQPLKGVMSLDSHGPHGAGQPPLGLPAGWEELWDWPGQLASLPCWELPEPPLGCPGGDSGEKQISRTQAHTLDSRAHCRGP